MDFQRPGSVSSWHIVLKVPKGTRKDNTRVQNAISKASVSAPLNILRRETSDMIAVIRTATGLSPRVAASISQALVGTGVSLNYTANTRHEKLICNDICRMIHYNLFTVDKITDLRKFNVRGNTEKVYSSNFGMQLRK